MKTMFDIFSAIAIVLLLANTSLAMSEEHPACSKEDNEYSLEMAGVDGDKAVQFGLTIQSAVRDRDITRIFAMVDGELQNGPRREFIKGKSFSQIFSEEWRSIILAQKPSCGPVGWRGFMLGNGELWYQFTNDGTGKIFVINGAQEEVPSSEIMMHAGSAIKPWCFTRIWRSGDNYEYFYEKYVDSDRDNLYSDAYNMFTRYIGEYFGSEVPLGSIASPWSGYGNSDTIALASEISECQQELSQEALEEFRPNSSYSVLKDVSNKYCKQLAPHIEGNCLDLALVTVTGPLGYSKTDVDTALYAVFEEEDADVYIVPLVNFDSANDGLNFVDSLLLDAGLAEGVSAASASDLPDCVEDSDSWNNCIGTHTYATGDKYAGEWKDDKPNGQGVFTSANGGQYVGRIKDGELNGQGTYTHLDGSKYVGGYKDGKRYGEGTSTYANGEKAYVGEWKDGEQNGQGTGTFPDGEKYVGDWKDGKRYGEGTTTYPDGTIIDGIWKDGFVFSRLEEVEAAEQVRIYEEQAQLYKERLARQERENKYERIYTACLLDKGSDVDMSVSSLEQAVKATCDSIAEDPSFLEGLRYD